MNVVLFPCGPAANESELKALEFLKSRLQSEPGGDNWILLANLAFSVTHQLQSDEIDLIVIGPAGARVIEIKHWTPQWMDGNRDLVQHEADRVTNKARKIGTTLRRSFANLPRVDGVILLTQDASKVKRLTGQDVRGVRFHSLSEWRPQSILMVRVLCHLRTSRVWAASWSRKVPLPSMGRSDVWQGM